jgi:hypothetical protein
VRAWSRMARPARKLPVSTPSSGPRL